jgi:hypothetical protein
MVNKIILALVVFSVFAQSCKKDEKTTNPVTPTVGITTKINGKSFTDDSTTEAFKNSTISTSIFAINTAGTSSIGIGFGTVSAGTFTIGSGNNGATYKAYDINGNDTIYSATQGLFIISKYDLLNNKLSGTFSFTAVNSATGRTVSITEGVITDIPIVE